MPTTKPLALLLYENLLPGSQLVNRLQDLNYRVQTLNDPALLVESAEQAKPLLVLADLTSTRADVCAAIAQLKQNPATRHLPVLAFGAQETPELETAARAAGASLLVSAAAILDQLPECLQQALQLE
jgi:CheY-like chemotaxis protein